jgi:ribosomal protein RSM22 (predicted rRNA methylase)
VQLPDMVKRAIDERADAIGFARLKGAAAAMSEAYREGRVARLADEDRVAAYLVTRMPATYAAAYRVLREVRERSGDAASVLDLGAGTGAASLAARQIFPNASITMVERDRALADAARAWLPDATILVQDLRAPAPPTDLTIAAYSLGEAGPAIPKDWRRFVAIEPGTPRGFELIRGIRDRLLADGAHMIAPCPMESACPSDWCHFAARVERSSIHRRVKEAELGYEDEKFSYVAVSQEPVAMAASRIVRHPQRQPGLIVLETCTPAGLTTERVTKRNRERFRAARKADWGDAGIS